MKHDHIEIAGKKFRVEFNWNAITDFLESENLSLADADNLKNLRPSQITGLIHAGVKEGCRLDKVEFNYTKTDFGAMIGPLEAGKIMFIYQQHTTRSKSAGEASQGDSDTSQKKRFLNRFRSKSSCR